VKICPVCSTEYPDEIKFCQNDGTTLRAAAPASDLVGQVIADRYHVVKKLGEGGMGQVYLAEHVKMGRRSAIKVMNPSMAHDSDAVARFNREAANASRITHPHVCAVYDFGETPDGLIYLAMEFVEGEPLTELLEREGALPLARAAHIFQQTADALQAAHDLGIVHRDLKPDNIMLAKTKGGADVVKVVDFGIAKAVGGDEAGQKVTKTGLVVGTPEFMSPEQLSGDKVDGRSDLYALALVFFRMLTGKLPFEASTVQETMIKRLTDEPTPLATTRPDLAFPAGLQEVLDAALTRSPTDRYQSVAKFAADVAGIVGTAPAGAALPPTRADVEARTQLLNAEKTKAMAAQAPSARTRTSAAMAAPPKRRSLVPVLVGAVLVLGGGGAAVKVLLFGPKADGRAVPPDTAHPVAVGDTQHRAAGQNKTPAGSNTHVVSLSGRDTTAGGGTAPAGGSRVNPARAFDVLDSLLAANNATTAHSVLEGARTIFYAPGVAQTDKAFAAYVTATALATLHDTTALEWAKRAATLHPGSAAYDRLVRDLSQP
jgi:eukaryotic-like serine/threonine-protein kinase